MHGGPKRRSRAAEGLARIRARADDAGELSTVKME
jgi:hypothetical protein